MACERINSTSSKNTNYILDSIKRIDQLQKEVLMENSTTGCDGPLISRLYDTKPVSFGLCGGTRLSAYVGYTGGTTELFRIEEVRGTDVVLRLLVNTEGTVTCTEYTCILDTNCCCSMQCFDPVNCEIMNN